MQDAMYRLQNLFGEALDRHDDNTFTEGFEAAAHICLDILSKNIDDLHKQIDTGDYLSNEEQALLSRLNRIKMETEKGLHRFSSRPMIDKETP
ncbi:hypothetical protein [Spirillospora sp. NPDC048823]|uniref:hypothetical protein n=1 Tax=unclassified Spirillospora TaxID=2642701 RepID=UPI0037160DDA